MKEVITLRQILNARYPNGHRLVSKINKNLTRQKKQI